MMGNKQELKILLYARINCNDPINLGAVKKYRGLQNGLRTLGYNTDLLWLSDKGLLVNKELSFPYRLNNSMETLRNIFFNFIVLDWHIARTLNFACYNIFFIRYPLSHPMFLYLLKKAKKSNPSMQIWLEVPTYPYHLELKGLLRYSQYVIDKLLRTLLRYYIDKVVHFGKFTSLFGISAVGIENGVDVSSFPVSTSNPVKGKIRLIAVGNWNHWHGLDRLLMGLSNYYKNNAQNHIIELTLVGGGREVPTYKTITDQLQLGSFVNFLPPTEGKALDLLFDEADLAIGCLGIHRKNVILDASLKHREYCARALPFILSTFDPDFPPHLPWVHYVPNDESSLNIEDLIMFSMATTEQKDLKLEMRQYALNNLDWTVKLEKLPFFEL